MDTSGRQYYEREASKLKLMNAAMQLALLQKQIGDQNILLRKEHTADTNADGNRSTTTTVRKDQNSQ